MDEKIFDAIMMEKDLRAIKIFVLSPLFQA
jgi:hypothetical protein